MKNLNKSNFLPLILVILDGFGIAPPRRSNAVWLAKTPNLDYFNRHYPHCQLTAHGKAVGLINGQDGNSEAGHMNIGAGRIVKQDAVLINEKIKDGSFYRNTALLSAVKHANKFKSNLHLMGLLSGGESAHSDPAHLYALLEFLKRQKFHRIYLHLFTDGRDSSPHAAASLFNKLAKNFKNKEIVSTIIGRFYAMDRIKTWSRTELAYNAMVLGEGIVADDAFKAITRAYNRGETDEFITPTIILNKEQPAQFINDNDSIIFFNLRSDRARQMAKPFVQPDFEKKNKGAFRRKKILKNLKFVGLTDFGPDLDSIATAFYSVKVEHVLPEALEKIRQLYISEREKYAHVTYFFNGGHGQPVNGEKWEVIASAGQSDYVRHPHMSTHRLTDIVCKNIEQNKYDFVCINFPNPDMLGHTGNLKATIEGIEAVDKNLGRLAKLLLSLNGTLIITADHGNAEEMLDLTTGEIDTEHSTNPVPFIIVNDTFKQKGLALRKNGILADVSPTILDLLSFKKPSQMTGKTLIKKH